MFENNPILKEAYEEKYSLYSLIDTLIKSYNITNIKLLEFNQK